MKRRVKLDGLELDCEIRGTGEPVVLVHAGLFADWFTPLVDQAALRPYQVVSFHRAGYAGSSRVEGPLSIAQQAAYVRALWRGPVVEAPFNLANVDGACPMFQPGGDLILWSSGQDRGPGAISTADGTGGSVYDLFWLKTEDMIAYYRAKAGLT